MSFLVTNPDTGAVVDCDQWGNVFNLACWGYGTSWGPSPTLNLPQPAAPAVVPLQAVSTGNMTGDEAAAIAQQASDAAVLATQGAISAANPASGDGSGIPSWVWFVAAGAVLVLFLKR